MTNYLLCGNCENEFAVTHELEMEMRCPLCEYQAEIDISAKVPLVFQVSEVFKRTLTPSIGILIFFISYLFMKQEPFGLIPIVLLWFITLGIIFVGSEIHYATIINGELSLPPVSWSFSPRNIPEIIVLLTICTLSLSTLIGIIACCDLLLTQLGLWTKSSFEKVKVKEP